LVVDPVGMDADHAVRHHCLGGFQGRNVAGCWPYAHKYGKSDRHFCDACFSVECRVKLLNRAVVVRLFGDRSLSGTQ